jgi:hypothetical protein
VARLSPTQARERATAWLDDLHWFLGSDNPLESTRRRHDDDRGRAFAAASLAVIVYV